MQPKNQRALVVIDVQNEYFTGNLRIEYPDVRQSLANICQAMDAAHAAGIPVVVVQHLLPEGFPVFARGSQGAELHPEVGRRHRDHPRRRCCGRRLLRRLADAPCRRRALGRRGCRTSTAPWRPARTGRAPGRHRMCQAHLGTGRQLSRPAQPVPPAALRGRPPRPRARRAGRGRGALSRPCR